ncbi:MAG: DUF1045 domain-containing protein [Bauldia sp.]|nr:DUF1045 domain-containing protein [Bauldia sp.]
MRIAVFFTPPRDHPLTNAAADWLGRDAFTDEIRPRGEVPGFDSDEIAALTADPRRYGFHATLKPPFRIAAGHNLDDIRAALAGFCRTQPAFTIPALELTALGPFFALTAGRATADVNELAAAVVRDLDPFRAPATEEEIARRRPESLSERQRDYLREWGYPYVFDEFQFHMTLTGRVPVARRAAMAEVLRRRFAPFIGRPLAIDALALFCEPLPPSDFFVDSHAALVPVKQAMAGT